jgi:TetR/AcrR family transcriptional regulator, transcriptional repressor for nem operon
MTHDFPDRHALIRAVIARRAREVIDFLSQPEIEGLDSLAKLRAWARMTVERQQGERHSGRLRARFAGRPVLRARRGRAHGDRQGLRCLDRRPGRRAAPDPAAGEIGPRADPEELATGLMAALQGGYTLAQATRAIAPMETALSMIDHIESFGATGDGTTASRAPRSRAQSRRRRYFRHLPWRGRRHLDADRDSVGYPKARSLAPTRLEGTATAAATRSTRGRVR